MRDDRCAVCRQRITMSGWEPFCCEVCWDSDDAQTRRELEGGLWDRLPKVAVDIDIDPGSRWHGRDF